MGDVSYTFPSSPQRLKRHKLQQVQSNHLFPQLVNICPVESPFTFRHYFQFFLGTPSSLSKPNFPPTSLLPVKEKKLPLTKNKKKKWPLQPLGSVRRPLPPPPVPLRLHPQQAPAGEPRRPACPVSRPQPRRRRRHRRRVRGASPAPAATATLPRTRRAPRVCSRPRQGRRGTRRAVTPVLSSRVPGGAEGPVGRRRVGVGGEVGACAVAGVWVRFWGRGNWGSGQAPECDGGLVVVACVWSLVLRNSWEDLRVSFG